MNHATHPLGKLYETSFDMANTYTQIHIHIICAVQNRSSLINPLWEGELYKYITGVIQNRNHKLLQINGMPDHIHLLIGMRPTQSLSELMKIIKGESAKWINKKRLIKGRFSWQAGYGAFSYSKSQTPTLISYIQNQKEHHRRKTLTEEYLDFLNAFKVEYDERFVLKSVE